MPSCNAARTTYCTEGRTRERSANTVGEFSAPSDRPQLKRPKSFSPSIKSAEGINIYLCESRRVGSSGSSFINESLLLLSQFQRVFSAENDSVLCELAACYTLLNDKVMPKVLQMAEDSRRDAVQMLLYLIERGLESFRADNELKLLLGDSDQSSLLRVDYKDICLPCAAFLEQPMTIYINLKTLEVINFLDREGNKQVNKTVFVNQLLLLFSKMPRVLSSPESPLLLELEEYKRLLADSLVSMIPQIAVPSRRDPVQMFLFLIERGMQQLSND